MVAGEGGTPPTPTSISLAAAMMVAVEVFVAAAVVVAMVDVATVVARRCPQLPSRCLLPAVWEGGPHGGALLQAI